MAACDTCPEACVTVGLFWLHLLSKYCGSEQASSLQPGCIFTAVTLTLTSVQLRVVKKLSYRECKNTMSMENLLKI